MKISFLPYYQFLKYRGKRRGWIKFHSWISTWLYLTIAFKGCDKRRWSFFEKMQDKEEYIFADWMRGKLIRFQSTKDNKTSDFCQTYPGISCKMERKEMERDKSIFSIIPVECFDLQKWISPLRRMGRQVRAMSP